ncbi:hypothetical protein GCM10009754_34250 [Amycolatopsis minnesotensis]|uniref:Uncharacterized protein n=1 Tax=Amycolatopsis minnesotensis TaxID=337894 RepID=A0ABP5CAB7_9PSEU
MWDIDRRNCLFVDYQLSILRAALSACPEGALESGAMRCAVRAGNAVLDVLKVPFGECAAVKGTFGACAGISQLAHRSRARTLRASRDVHAEEVALRGPARLRGAHALKGTLRESDAAKGTAHGGSLASRGRLHTRGCP